MNLSAGTWPKVKTRIEPGVQVVIEVDAPCWVLEMSFVGPAGPWFEKERGHGEATIEIGPYDQQTAWYRVVPCELPEQPQTE
jgi:hypothetical protein